jgi:hypothetical protein
MNVKLQSLKYKMRSQVPYTDGNIIEMNIIQDVSIMQACIFTGILIVVVPAAPVEISAKVKHRDISIIMSAILHITTNNDCDKNFFLQLFK